MELITKRYEFQAVRVKMLKKELCRMVFLEVLAFQIIYEILEN